MSTLVGMCLNGRYRLDAINEAVASSRSGRALRNMIVF